MLTARVMGARGVVLGAMAACGSRRRRQPAEGGEPVPAELQTGEAKFKPTVRLPRGRQGVGTESGACARP